MEEKEIKKRGRKKGTNRKGYYYETEEEMFCKFLKAETQEERDTIFRTYLYIPFTKMIESIIRRYNLYMYNETFDETFHDCYSNLLEKMGKFDPTKGFKSYSYCQTIVKNYLLQKRKKIQKELCLHIPYEDISSMVEEDEKYSYTIDDDNFEVSVIEKSIKEIEGILESTSLKQPLTDNEIKVGTSLLKLLKERETLFVEMGSEKWNKNYFLYFIKETTLLNTNEIRKAMNRFKKCYFGMKFDMLNCS